MKITSNIYAGLSAPERIRATVSAEARNDKNELQMLKDTCPKRTYQMNDTAYNEGMRNLMWTALTVEYNLMAFALDYITADDPYEIEKADSAISSFASVEKAWRMALDEIGIPLLDLKKAGHPRHRYVEIISLISHGEENEDEVTSYLEHLRSCIVT